MLNVLAFISVYIMRTFQIHWRIVETRSKNDKVC